MYSYNSSHKVIFVLLILGGIMLHFYMNQTDENLYYENGQIKCEGEHVNEIKEGLWIWYFPNGNKMLKGEFLNGNRQGIWTSYHENGKLSMTSTYQDNRLEGLLTEYNVDEKIIRQVDYRNDTIFKTLFVQKQIFSENPHVK